MFQIESEPARQLADWLAVALLAGGRPPILVITCEARDEAAAKLRKIIDPTPQPLFPLPHTASQFGQLALTNRILAFALYGNLTECKQRALNTLCQGMTGEAKRGEQASWRKIHQGCASYHRRGGNQCENQPPSNYRGNQLCRPRRPSANLGRPAKPRRSNTKSCSSAGYRNYL